MKKDKSDFGLYVKMFEHKFKAKYNRAKVKQLEQKLNAAEKHHEDIEDYIHEVDHRGHGMMYQW